MLIGFLHLYTNETYRSIHFPFKASLMQRYADGLFYIYVVCTQLSDSKLLVSAICIVRQ